MKPCLIAALLLAAFCASASADLKYKDDFLKRLVQRVPEILKSQDPKTGYFGEGVFIVRDQHPMYTLAVIWSIKSADNPYYHDPKLLDAVMAGGDALIRAQDKDGKWRFDKKDGSNWGMIHMPWTYSRWIRSFGLMKMAMPAEKRKQWEDALTLGYTGIAKANLGSVHNIPTHHAMGLYIAGQVLNKPEWCQQAKEFMAKVVAAQDPGGFWTEHHGPVVLYDFVYMEALGIYYAVSKDATVLPALEKAAQFHVAFTYPDGTCVETIDERNPYKPSNRIRTVAFTTSAVGRGYVKRQLLDRSETLFQEDGMASLLLYGEEGPTESLVAEGDGIFVITGDKALIRRKGPWFVCLSSYFCPVPDSRWLQDRQNLVSVYHDKTGLILGGGNTKLQPLWSNFTVGDTSLLKHKPGDEKPKFTPDGPLFHVPSDARLVKTDPVGLELKYGEEECNIAVEPVDDAKLNIRLRATAKSGMPVEGHLTLISHFDQPFKTERGIEKDLDKDQFTLTADEAGKWIEHAGWRLALPAGSKVTWPVQPHDPYVKDGAPKPRDGRIVVSVPFSKGKTEHVLELTITE